MKTLLKTSFLGFIGVLLFCSMVYAEKGIVIKEHNSKYAIYYSLGFLLVDWYGGYIPAEDDVYVGDFSGYGLKTFYCINADAETDFWVEEFMASEDEAWEFLYD